MQGKVVIVTGSSGGIGRAIALECAKQGAKVVLNGRDPAKLEKVQLLLKETGAEVTLYAADITDLNQCQQLVAHTITTFGRLDALITNASVMMRSRFDRMEPHYFKTILDSNIYGAVMPAYAALDALKASKGSLVLISSVAGLYGLPSASAYSAGKMALTALAQSLRGELSGDGVHVGIVYVGFTENDASKRVLAGDGTPVEVAPRPPVLQQTQEQVAQSVIRLIRHRKAATTLSAVGVVTKFVARYFPSVIAFAVRISQKRMRKMYEG